MGTEGSTSNRHARRRIATRSTAATWGRTRLAGVDGLDRFVEVAEKLVDGARSAGLSLFAGWRAEPRPDDTAGRAYLLTHVLREWRGSAHICATVGAGLSALESILAKPSGGAEQAPLFGWPAPHEDVTDEVSTRRLAAEAHTDQLLVADYDRLTGAERADLLAGAESIVAAIRA